jgi:CBS domain-containing protein
LKKEFSMKVREAMTTDPVCCVPSDTTQKVASILCEKRVGSLPVVEDQQSRKLIGVITDRDLCCSVVAHGLDPKTTVIEKYISLSPVTCRDGENLDSCERLMQEHQIRRIPIVDGEGRCIGILSQADMALKDKPEKVGKTVAEISKPASEAPSKAA